jgi:ribonucleoside-diphosphate reductase alpha chain
MENVVAPKVSGVLYDELQKAITNMDVLPSMRGLMTAGKALERDNAALFNCSYIPIDHPRAFDEAMYILMCGTGVGFTVERQDISKLPAVAETFHETDTTIHVKDSKVGWATAFKELLSMLYAGQVPKWDVSKVRPAGARLKVFGGRASGPEPLINLFKFCVKTFQHAAGRKLTSLECHDIMCKVGETVVVGGVRRSALISLSNLSDDRMRGAKSGAWWEHNPQRSLANNSVCYTERPDMQSYLKEWLSMYESQSGERGIFNRVAAKKQAAKNGRRDVNHEFGTNPCSEIILRPYQFCNLTTIVARADDTRESLLDKVAKATVLGTVQATFTNFRYLRPIWKRNTEEEALLGVSITGILDCPLLGRNYYEREELLNELRDKAIEVNKEWSAALGINQSTAITCVKPEGTVSQLVGAASGIHPRFAPYYIRRVRNSMNDPLTQFLASQGVPWEVDVMSPATAVFSFPQKSPEGAVCKDDLTAIQQMELWKAYQDDYCEHKPSITVYYNENEYMELGSWVWSHFDEISGVAFLPRVDHTYQQAPYEAITKEQYEQLVANTVAVDWEQFKESEDNTEGSQTLACVGTSCEVP